MYFCGNFFIVSNIAEAESMVREWNYNGKNSHYTDISFYTQDASLELHVIGHVENRPPNFGFVWTIKS